MTGGFSCTVQVTVKEKNYEAKLERTAVGVCRLTLLAPKALEGLTFDWDGEELSLQYKGLNWDMDAKKLPETSFASALCGSLDAAAKQESLTILKRKDHLVQAKGMGQSGEFELTYNEETGQVESLTIEGLGLTASFQDYI